MIVLKTRTTKPYIFLYCVVESDKTNIPRNYWVRRRKMLFFFFFFFVMVSQTNTRIAKLLDSKEIRTFHSCSLVHYSNEQHKLDYINFERLNLY